MFDHLVDQNQRTGRLIAIHQRRRSAPQVAHRLARSARGDRGIRDDLSLEGPSERDLVGSKWASARGIEEEVGRRPLLLGGMAKNRPHHGLECRVETLQVPVDVAHADTHTTLAEQRIQERVRNDIHEFPEC